VEEGFSEWVDPLEKGIENEEEGISDEESEEASLQELKEESKGLSPFETSNDNSYKLPALSVIPGIYLYLLFIIYLFLFFK
jgi:hypothetical protein